MEKRKIERGIVTETMKNPAQKIKKPEKYVYQSKYFDGKLGKEMLLRIFVKEDIKGLTIITLYKTSKIGKYWKV